MILEHVGGTDVWRVSFPHVVLSETESDTPVSFHFYFLFVTNHKQERGSQQIRDTSYQI